MDKCITLLGIGYLFIIVPVVLGIFFDKKDKIDFAKAWISGFVGLYGVLISIFFVERQIDTVRIWMKQYGIYGFIVVTGLLFLIVLYKVIKRKLLLLWNREYLKQEVTLLGITAFMVVFRQDTSLDSVLEHANAIQMGYTKEHLASYWIEYCSEFCHMPATVMGKWIMPFILSFATITVWKMLIEKMTVSIKDRKKLLWILEACLLFFAFPIEGSFRDFWEMPWAATSILVYIFVPYFLYLLADTEWNVKKAVLVIIMLNTFLCLGFFADDEMLMGAFVNILLFGLFLAVYRWWLSRNHIVFRGKWITWVVTPGICLLSIIFHGCIITESRYAIPDNKYKMDKSVMQLRILAQEVSKPVMLGDLQVLSQINDCDTFVTIPYDADILQREVEPQDEHLLDTVKTLELNHYEPIVMIQKAEMLGCNLIAYPISKDFTENPEEIFAYFGYRVLGVDDKYVLYCSE